METDAIVLPANPGLHEGPGTSTAIYEAAGREELAKACHTLYPQGCELGSAVITDGFNLKAKKIIHAVCPIWFGGDKGEDKLLYSTYAASLRLARDAGLESISFPPPCRKRWLS